MHLIAPKQTTPNTEWGQSFDPVIMLILYVDMVILYSQISILANHAFFSFGETWLFPDNPSAAKNVLSWLPQQNYWIVLN